MIFESRIGPVLFFLVFLISCGPGSSDEVHERRFRKTQLAQEIAMFRQHCYLPTRAGDAKWNESENWELSESYVSGTYGSVTPAFENPRFGGRRVSCRQWAEGIPAYPLGLELALFKYSVCDEKMNASGSIGSVGRTVLRGWCKIVKGVSVDTLREVCNKPKIRDKLPVFLSQINTKLQKEFAATGWFENDPARRTDPLEPVGWIDAENYPKFEAAYAIKKL